MDSQTRRVIIDLLSKATHFDGYKIVQVEHFGMITDSEHFTIQVGGISHDISFPADLSLVLNHQDNQTKGKEAAHE